MNEGLIVAHLNRSIELNKLKAIAYKFNHATFCFQLSDILIDSATGSYYALEVKSIDLNKKNPPKIWYAYYNEYEQYKKMLKFCSVSGRVGYYVFVLRSGKGKKLEIIPIDITNMDKFDNGKSLRITIEEIKNLKDDFFYTKFFRSLDR